MDAQEWQRSLDAVAMIEFASARIETRHTALVLAEIVEAALPVWSSAFPHDPSVGKLLGVIRAYCLDDSVFDAFEEARRATEEAGRVAFAMHVEFLRTRRKYPADGNGPKDPLPFAASCVAKAALAVAQYADWVEEPETRPSKPAGDALYYSVRARVDVAPAVQRARLQDPNGAGTGDAWEDLPPEERGIFITAHHNEEVRIMRATADRLRTVIPYPSRSSFGWEPSQGWVRAGDALLKLDGVNLLQGMPLKR